jgi:methylisocitrate lyase
MHASPGQHLRNLVRHDTIAVPRAPNALAGRMAERMGFEALYLSGAAISAGVLARPDIGLITLPQLIEQTSLLVHAVDVPVIIDADTGYGDAEQVARTVHDLAAVRAAGIQLEDQEMPKRCGHLGGKTLVSTAEMVEKIRAAATTRGDDGPVIIARTDARGCTSFDDAVERAKSYLEAGAEWIFPEALASREEFAKFAEAVDAPLVANMTEFGKSPLLTVDELAELGFSVVLYPVTLLRVAMKAMEAALGMLITEGTQKELLDVMQTREELYELLDYTP